MLPDKRYRTLYLFLATALVLNVALWFHSSKIYVKWANVPPAPDKVGARMGFLGDDALAFRASGLALQNYGSAGISQSLNNYNYETLAKWFWLMHALDPHSRFVPYLASYYFAAVQDPEKLPPLIHYLEEVGAEPREGNWRWMAQAVFLTQHRLRDQEEALRIAHRLGKLYKPPMPIWTRNMESMLKANMGDKEAAYLLMLEILKSDGAKMSASEYNSNIKYYLYADTDARAGENQSGLSKKSLDESYFRQVLIN